MGMVNYPLKEGTYSLSSGYGPRWGTFHAGLDFAAPLGTPIYAVADGVIVQGADRAPGSVSGFGNWIWQDSQREHGVDFIYGHMRHHEIYVRAGDRVTAGQLIARVGSEGGSTGPHLHLEVWGPPGRVGGKHQDPAAWLHAHTQQTPPQGGTVTIFGVDVSEHQDGMSLARAKAEGIDFAIIRLCDGTYRDRVFASHLADAESAGLLVATYWYLRAPSEGTSIAQQVDVIDQQMGGRRDLPVWIDVESVAPDGRKLLTKDDVWAAKRELEGRGYRVPGIYSGAWYWERMPGGEPSMDGLGALWVSSYGRNRTSPYREAYVGDGGDQHPGWSYPLGDRTPDILQYGSNGQVAGFIVDVNAYRGTRDQLAAIFNGNTAQPNGGTPMSELSGVSAAALNDAKLAAIESVDRLRAQDAPITSIVNPDVKFSPRDLAAVQDLNGWCALILAKAIARKLGLDPETIISTAIADDRARTGGKK